MTEITDADREAANKAFDIAFQGDTTTIDDDMARLFAGYRIAAQEKERADVVAWLETQGWRAGILSRLVSRGEHKK